ncbi:unnamed protein product [[Candida] boidinii]|uniref:Required for respiratory growth protein 8, mitochondrial n=1 Tax=Candida boidinii TaxID=5477 RepID=A0A9W6SUH1_CANBO|nr:hypothetical protein B5S30_g3885 [[Candida] boidinii]OWB81566.1 hypothetical protein B5S33_g185 [[Candida] boidinii]GME67232.1 unnamed protein product [[Candida] boidinii]GMF57626.1 unnamed protein product [[Candida] boidinii]GMF98032.1 unnamed protein product [[Candida] boidinii]
MSGGKVRRLKFPFKLLEKSQKRKRTPFTPVDIDKDKILENSPVFQKPEKWISGTKKLLNTEANTFKTYVPIENNIYAEFLASPSRNQAVSKINFPRSLLIPLTIAKDKLNRNSEIEDEMLDNVLVPKLEFQSITDAPTIYFPLNSFFLKNITELNLKAGKSRRNKLAKKIKTLEVAERKGDSETDTLEITKTVVPGYLIPLLYGNQDPVYWMNITNDVLQFTLVKELTNSFNKLKDGKYSFRKSAKSSDLSITLSFNEDSANGVFQFTHDPTDSGTVIPVFNIPFILKREKNLQDLFYNELKEHLDPNQMITLRNIKSNRKSLENLREFSYNLYKLVIFNEVENIQLTKDENNNP